MSNVAFRPSVLEEDRVTVVSAHGTCLSGKKELYAKHARVNAFAAKKGDVALREAVEKWVECGDMVVSTDFDIIHFEAQIRHRAAMLRPDLVEGLKSVLKGLRERNAIAREELPEATELLTRLYGDAQ